MKLVWLNLSWDTLLVVGAVGLSTMETAAFNLFGYLQMGKLRWLQIRFLLQLPDLTPVETVPSVCPSF